MAAIYFYLAWQVLQRVAGLQTVTVLSGFAGSSDVAIILSTPYHFHNLGILFTDLLLRHHSCRSFGMETDGRFSYTLDGFFEAREYLRKNDWLDKVDRQHFKGLQLIETANRLYKMIINSR